VLFPQGGKGFNAGGHNLKRADDPGQGPQRSSDRYAALESVVRLWPF
jgi:hypothetical protein